MLPITKDALKIYKEVIKWTPTRNSLGLKQEDQIIIVIITYIKLFLKYLPQSDHGVSYIRIENL